jgi:hypothetical protein
VGKLQKAEDLKVVPRLQVLTMKRSDEADAEYKTRLREEELLIPSGSLKASLEVLRSPRVDLEEWEFGAAFGALLLALTLQGTGAMTRRGFGHLRVEIAEAGSAFSSPVLGKYREAVSKIYSDATDPDVLEAYRRIIKTSLEYGAKTVDLRISQKPRQTMPAFPVVSLDDQIFSYGVVPEKVTLILPGLGHEALLVEVGRELGDESELECDLRNEQGIARALVI